MLRALWFAVKVGIISFAAVWVANRPGFVEITWLNYDIRIQIGFALLLLLALGVVWHFLLKLWSLPKTMRLYAQGARARRGQRAVVLALSAIAAGDGQGAVRHAARARKYLPHDRGMTLFVDAQAARLSGDVQGAREAYVQLLGRKDTAFLGLRGLMIAAIEDGHMSDALTFARRAQELYPKQPWVLRLVYDLQLRDGQWDRAFDTLRRLEKIGGLPRADLVADQQALLLRQADQDLENGLAKTALRKMRRAYRLDPGFTPAAIRYARALIAQDQRKAAVRVIEHAWAGQPHPELAALWGDVAPQNKASDAAVRLRWFEKLVALRPDSDESQLAVAQAAIADRLWGEARPYLTRAENIRASARLYRLWARMEDAQGRPEQARHYLDKADGAEADPVWTCRETGHVYDTWSPVAAPHGAFNTIVWDYPHRVAALRSAQAGDMRAGDVLAPPFDSGIWHARAQTL